MNRAPQKTTQGNHDMKDKQAPDAPARPMLLPIGHGRMGSLVTALAADAGFDTAPPLDSENNAGGAGLTDERLKNIAVEKSTAAAVEENLPRLADAGVDIVIGTTGWHKNRERIRSLCLDAEIGVVAAANFSVGVQLFLALARHAGTLFADRTEFGAYIHEHHHAMKADAPSGTARELEVQLVIGGYDGPIDMSSTRAGHAPGTHTVGLDSPTEAVTLTHQTRDRRTFAAGALVAARWLVSQRRHGWFSMADVLGLDYDRLTHGRRR